MGYKLKKKFAERSSDPTPLPSPGQTPYLSGEKIESQKRGGGNDQNAQYISLPECEVEALCVLRNFLAELVNLFGEERGVLEEFLDAFLHADCFLEDFLAPGVEGVDQQWKF